LSNIVSELTETNIESATNELMTAEDRENTEPNGS